MQDPYEKNILGLGRDPERTPMQWDASPNAGFTTGTPWLPIADDYQSNNVAKEREDNRSMLALYKRLIGLRRANRALSVGSYAPLPTPGETIAYVRACGDDRFVTLLNFSSQPVTIDMAMPGSRASVALSTHLDREGEQISGEVSLRPDEGLLLQVRAAA